MGTTTNKLNTVPNQRIISVNKSATDKQHLYTTNNLSAIDEAASLLQTVGGFKLYIYLAKNQNDYTFALSSSHFFEWSGLGKQAYTTAFNELIEKGYLVKDSYQNNKFIFYDKSQREQPEEEGIVIEYADNNRFVF